MTETVSLRLWPKPASAGQARRFVRDNCVGMPQTVIDDACLLVSELVTNGVLHAHTMMTIAVAREAGSVSVAVRDDSSVAVPGSQVAAATEEHGRGLGIVNAVSRSWGVASSESGKSVWFRLP